MSGNYRNSQQPQQQQQQQYYQQEEFYPGQEHQGTVYYQQPQYVNQQHFQQQAMPSQQPFYFQAPPTFYNQAQPSFTQAQPNYNQGYNQGYNQVYYPDNQMDNGDYGYAHDMAQPQGQPYAQGVPRGRGRGQRGGRGRGYQSRGRHKRFNENHGFDQNSADLNEDSGSSRQSSKQDSHKRSSDNKSRDKNNKSRPAETRGSSSTSQGAEGGGSSANENTKPILHFNDAKDHYAGDEEEKSFADLVGPEKNSTKKGYNNRGGRSYSRGTHRGRGAHAGVRGGYSGSRGAHSGRQGRNQGGESTRDESWGENGGDLKVAQREAREKLLANQRRRQLPESDDEIDAESAEIPENESAAIQSGRQPVQNIRFRGAVRGSNTRGRGGVSGNTRRDDRGQHQHQRRGRVALERENSETQRGTLIEQLRSATYECMICCDNVRCEAAIWSCSNCYNVFHLRCVKKWARSPAAAIENRDGTTGGWRCPGCQHVAQRYPNTYRCFCGRMKDPLFSRHETPHSCAELCRKSRGTNCSHPCNILCHPGPCPDCMATVNRRCDCGKTKQTLKCSQATTVKCAEVCEKVLNCGKHSCKQVCHPRSCSPCEEVVHQECYCGKVSREVVCGTAESFTAQFSCDSVCDKTLECGEHACLSHCHPGVCAPCTLLPSSVTHCSCGRTPLTEITENTRTSCTDVIPTCGNICGKDLKCGPNDDPHKCEKTCHAGECGACDLFTDVKCRCGAITKNLSCKRVLQYDDENPFTCDKRCPKRRRCGMHKCGKRCCVDQDHDCQLICRHQLTCGLHRCEEPCHRGNCPVCWHVSFDELRCYCGFEVLYPPVPCGARPPECAQVCTRDHSCEHPVRHTCHNEDTCPPCAELTEKWCMGRHERRRNIPCHLADISCGMPCKKELNCGGRHLCVKGCHKDTCVSEGETCTQPCTRPRDECGHPCGNPCHGEASCPRTACQTKITIRCKCGNRTGNAVCMIGGENKDYNRMASMMMAMKMADMQSGQSIDISTLTGTEVGKKKTRQLECTEECGVIERNRRLALALEIKNPDVSGKLGTPSYPDFLRDSARKYSSYVSKVEKALSDLVHSAQKSKQSKRSHAFPPGNQVQRRVIHELAEFYGCSTQSYDEEPNKNVVATAYKDKCWHPNVSLTQVVQREVHGKVLSAPIPLGSKEKDIRSSQQAIKQSTKVLGVGAWGRPAQHPGGGADSGGAVSGGGGKPAWGPQTSTTTTKSGGGGAAWGPLQTGAPPIAPSKPAPWTSGAAAAPSGGGVMSGTSGASSSWKKEEPIDYFDMTG